MAKKVLHFKSKKKYHDYLAFKNMHVKNAPHHHFGVEIAGHVHKVVHRLKGGK